MLQILKLYLNKNFLLRNKENVDFVNIKYWRYLLYWRLNPLNLIFKFMYL